jgi:hypothetical protein
VLCLTGEVGGGEVFFDLGEDYPRVAVVGLGKHPRDVKLTSEQEDYREGMCAHRSRYLGLCCR